MHIIIIIRITKAQDEDVPAADVLAAFTDRTDHGMMLDDAAVDDLGLRFADAVVGTKQLGCRFSASLVARSLSDRRSFPRGATCTVELDYLILFQVPISAMYYGS